MKSIGKASFPLLVLTLLSCSGPSTSASLSESESKEDSFDASSSSVYEKIDMADINAKFYGPIAHRGYHGSSNPKNSMSAFKEAAKVGFAIETDVHITADDALIISHDSYLEGYGNIETNDFEDIRSNVLLENGEELPSLGEAFEFSKETDTPIFLELKTFSPDEENPLRLANAVLKEARKYEISAKNLLICSFSWEAIIPFLCSEYAAGLFISNGTNKELIGTVLAAESPTANYPDFVAAGYDVTPKAECKSYRQKGHKVFSWTLISQSMYDEQQTISDGFIFEGFFPV